MCYQPGLFILEKAVNGVESVCPVWAGLLFFFIWVILPLCCGEGGRLSGTTGSPVGSLVPALCVPVLLVGRSSGLGMHLLAVLLLWEAIA